MSNYTRYAWAVNYNGHVGYAEINDTTVGARAVVEIYKDPSKVVTNPNSNLKKAYVYDESTCQTGNEPGCVQTTCVRSNTAGSCPVGTIIDFQVNSTTTNNTNKNDVYTGRMRFHVLKDNGSTLLLQTQRNVVKGVAWYTSSSDNTKGPTTIVPELESKTSGWSNVNTLNTSYSTSVAKCSLSGNTASCTTGYPTYTRSGNKARLISLTEAASTSIGNCSSSAGSCRKFMSNYLYQQSNYNNTYYDSTDGNEGYWTSSAASYDSTFAWHVRYWGLVITLNTPATDYGARAVVEINK